VDDCPASFRLFQTSPCRRVSDGFGLARTRTPPAIGLYIVRSKWTSQPTPGDVRDSADSTTGIYWTHSSVERQFPHHAVGDDRGCGGLSCDRAFTGECCFSKEITAESTNPTSGAFHAGKLQASLDLHRAGIRTPDPNESPSSTARWMLRLPQVRGLGSWVALLSRVRDEVCGKVAAHCSGAMRVYPRRHSIRGMAGSRVGRLRHFPRFGHMSECSAQALAARCHDEPRLIHRRPDVPSRHRQ
jgi:hypothetical protein